MDPEKYLAGLRVELAEARRSGDKTHESAVLAELTRLGAPEKERAVKGAAPEKRAAKPKAD